MPRAAVLGSPVEHSLSPALHRAAYDALGLSDWHYEAIDCDESRLPALLDTLDESWAGLSLTMPLKRAVMPLLDEVSDLARRVEAVNTVVLSGGPLSSGHRSGENTDVHGLAAALDEAGCPSSLDRGRVVVLGGGATACSALAALAGLGAGVVTLCVRSPERARQARRVAGRFAVEVDVQPWERAGDLAAHAGPEGVVVSTVPSGAADALADSWDHLPSRSSGGGLLLDVVYAPWPTALAAAWVRRGGRVVGGLEMLVQQAVEQVELFTGRRPPAAVMRAAGQQALSAS